MTFLEWILNKLRNGEVVEDEEFDQIPLRIEKDEPQKTKKPAKEEKKEEKRVIIIDL